MRVIEFYDGVNDNYVMRFDILFGWASTYPELSVALAVEEESAMAVLLNQAYAGYQAGTVVVLPSDTETALVAQVSRPCLRRFRRLALSLSTFCAAAQRWRRAHRRWSSRVRSAPQSVVLHKWLRRLRTARSRPSCAVRRAMGRSRSTDRPSPRLQRRSRGS